VAVKANFCPADPGISVTAEGEIEREKSGWSCKVGVDPPQAERNAVRGRTSRKKTSDLVWNPKS
jgi:hypothetical protein